MSGWRAQIRDKINFMTIWEAVVVIGKENPPLYISHKI
jgi:hypothetical protein